MNNHQVLYKIAEFAEYGECVVVKHNDWDALEKWVKSLPEEVFTDRPNFDILPIFFKKEVDSED